MKKPSTKKSSTASKTANRASLARAIRSGTGLRVVAVKHGSAATRTVKPAATARKARTAADRDARRKIADAFYDEKLCDAATKAAKADMAQFWEQPPTK
jgi:hypothetical protein